LVRFRGLAVFRIFFAIIASNGERYQVPQRTQVERGVTTKDAIRQTKTALLTSSEKGRTERERWMMVHAIDSLYRVPEAIHITSISARQTLTWPN
jgi:hypothetical protein